MKLSVLASQINAVLYGSDLSLPPISIDSRKIKAGELFLALKGENYDGHDYITDAIEKGAKAVIAQRPPLTALEKSISFIEVKDTIAALGHIAAIWRSQYPIPLVGITGSCGKTTVKEMVAAICQQKGKTLTTTGNFNNHIGLPLNILRLDATYQFAVMEMGASAIGEIHYLGKMAKPDIGLITNIAPAHILGFGSIENIAKAKAEIYDILPADGIAIVSQAEPYTALWQSIIGDRQQITFGIDAAALIRAENIRYASHQVEFTLCLPAQHFTVKLAIPGRHMVLNALAAASVGIALGIEEEKIVAGLAQFQEIDGRLRSYSGYKGITIIDDSYNANPRSMQAALEVLSHYPGKRMFIMGDMAELGNNAIAYHIEIGKKAKERGIEHLWAVGKLSTHAVHAFGHGALHYTTQEDLISSLISSGSLDANVVVLVKGSRSAKMENIVNALTKEQIG